ncbi:hypothetical protein, partial [Escherichia coli]|uniref:hypothetical protein n=1 Tax=Escherichia coli TaxID=562 RepID=UPI001BFC20BB
RQLTLSNQSVVSTDKPEGERIFSGVLLVLLKEFTFLNFQDTHPPWILCAHTRKLKIGSK